MDILLCTVAIGAYVLDNSIKTDKTKRQEVCSTSWRFLCLNMDRYQRIVLLRILVPI